MPIAIVAGTRPEFIKILPLYKALNTRQLTSEIIYTGQHSDLAEEHLTQLRISPPHQLPNLSESLAERVGQYVSDISKSIQKLGITDLVVQGDTASSMAGAIAGTLADVRVMHLEAGLRTFDQRDPWPEEKIRKSISHLADYHFAPTQGARINLESEGVDPKTIFVTGNTSIDALMNLNFHPGGKESRNIVTITLHRREGHGAARVTALGKILALAKERPELIFTFVKHPNPQVNIDFEAVAFDSQPNVRFEAPLRHADFVNLLASSFAAISDSGGVQEEAPTIRTPVFVARDVTERPEGVREGFATLVGKSLQSLTTESFTNFVQSYDRSTLGKSNPYGDGKSAERIVDAIMQIRRESATRS